MALCGCPATTCRTPSGATRDGCGPCWHRAPGRALIQISQMTESPSRACRWRRPSVAPATVNASASASVMYSRWPSRPTADIDWVLSVTRVRALRNRLSMLAFFVHAEARAPSVDRHRANLLPIDWSTNRGELSPQALARNLSAVIHRGCGPATSASQRCARGDAR